MKRFLLTILLWVHFSAVFAETYYSQDAQTNPNAFASWNTNPMGGGATPGSFTNADDIFIIQGGHTMATTGTWTIGNGNSFLIIQNGATLQGDHLIQFTGTFQIDNAGTYIHNNNETVAQIPAGTSIFSGTESFGASSNFEIRNWQIGPIQGLPNSPPGITWGNLIINLQVDLGGAWNWQINDGATLNIAGNLDVRQTYGGTTAYELRLTGTGIQTINVGGNFLLSGVKTQVAVKSRSSATVDDFTTMQVNGNVSLTGTARLDLGINTTSITSVGLYELRFKGNFSADVGTTITSTATGQYSPYLAANGTSLQTFTCPVLLNCNFRVAPGAIVDQSVSLANNGGRVFAILGTYNDNGFTNTLSGPLEVAGGTFNLTGSLAMGGNICRSCTGMGTYVNAGDRWCNVMGSRGRINFTSNASNIVNTVTFDKSNSAILYAGFSTSPGDIYLTDHAIVGFNGSGSGFGAVYIYAGSTLSIDGTSYIHGDAAYSGSGGTLRIGSSQGITSLPSLSGNIRVTSMRAYDNSSINSFEYFGTTTQVTGDGLPTNIDGTLKINNTAGMGTTGVTLSQNTTVSGVLDLTDGKLTTSAPAILNMADNATAINYSNDSFVYGPMTKTGDETFLFPVGEGAELHTAELIQVSDDASSDVFRVEYFKADPQLVHAFTPGAGINHISALEYWQIDKLAGSGSLTKKVTLLATTYSDATDLTKLRIVHYSGGSWQNDGNTASGIGSSGPVTSDNVTTFGITSGPFTFGSIDGYDGNPLPINLISFNAVKLNASKSLLSWDLATCCSPAAKFEIQRAGTNRNFVTVAAVAGSGTNRFYHYNDNGLRNGINYYRLKMMDADGTVTYSRTVAVMNGVEGLLLTSLIPTVITNTATLTIASSAAQKIDIMIIDMQGRVVRRQNYAVGEGNSNIRLSTGDLPAGAYQLIGVAAEGKTNMIRFIKQ